MRLTPIFRHSLPLEAAQNATKAVALFAIVSIVILSGVVAGPVSAEEVTEPPVIEEVVEILEDEADLISNWPEIPDQIFRPVEHNEEEGMEEDSEEDSEEFSEEESEEDTESDYFEEVIETEPVIDEQEVQEPEQIEGSIETIPETLLEGEEGRESETGEVWVMGEDGELILLEMEPPEEVVDPGKGYLLDQNWNEVRFSDLQEKIVLVTFFYSECKYSHCTYLNNKMKFISRKFVEEVGQDLMLVSISFDPSIDTVENLKEYSAKWEPDPTRWAFLTGDEADIVRLSKRFGIKFKWIDGDQSYNHSVRTFLVDQKGEIVRTYRGMDYNHRDAIDDIKNLLKGETLTVQEEYRVPTESDGETDVEDEVMEKPEEKVEKKTAKTQKGKKKKASKKR